MRKRQRCGKRFLAMLFLAAGVFFMASPAPAAIPNGGFESGPAAWTEDSNQFLLPLAFQTGLVQLPPKSGNFAAWLCGATNEISNISQEVAVPLGNPFLVYWRWIDSNAPKGIHEGQIAINGNIIEKFDLSLETATNGWSFQSLDLRNFEGRSVTLEFRGICDSPDERVSNLFLDEIAFQASGILQYFLPVIFKQL